MAQERTALQLVGYVRSLILEKTGNIQFRDGFTDDTSPDAVAVSILEAINLAQRKLAFTGYAEGNQTKDLSAATGITTNHQYTLDANVIRVTSVSLLSVDSSQIYDLDPMEPNTVNRMKARIRFSNAGRPKEWYSRLNIVGFNPKPDAAYHALCDTHIVPPDLANDSANKGDFPQYLPAYFHDALAWGAAIIISAMQVENAAAQNRVPMLQQFYNGYVDELASACGTDPEPARIHLDLGNEPRNLIAVKA